ncbi:hypothetical protein [Streptomyces sp. NBC_00035]|uniref:hypothetical protein n=1 Tax=Streptomyces sp. NBC_00035 TaxID=2903614 RepID=UPI00324F2513
MPRLQILQLPQGASDERAPYILVIDQAPRDEPAFTAFREDLELVAERTGARAVLCFEDTMGIPANDIPLDETGQPVFLRVEGDFAAFRDQAEEEIRQVQARLSAAQGRP